MILGFLSRPLGSGCLVSLKLCIFFCLGVPLQCSVALLECEWLQSAWWESLLVFLCGCGVLLASVFVSVLAQFSVN
jgi:hypothetical protein